VQQKTINPYKRERKTRAAERERQRERERAFILHHYYYLYIIYSSFEDLFCNSLIFLFFLILFFN